MRIRGSELAGSRTRSRAFTLLEVMLAMGMFCVAMFAILNLVSQNLKIARGLDMGQADIGTVAAQVALTNRLDEGVTSGDFGEFYPDASWTADVSLYSSNGLYQADISILWPRNGLLKEQKASILLYRPDSVVRAGGLRH